MKLIFVAISLEELEPVQGKTDIRKARCLDLNIKIRREKCQVGLFDIVRMPDQLSDVPSNIVYSATGAESSRTTKSSNNLQSCSK